MHLPPDTSLAGQIAAIQEELKDLRQSGGRVYNPTTGLFVPLSSLAFGLATAEDPAYTEINAGTVSGPGGLGWFYGPPQLDVFVSGGNLLVFSAAAVQAQGNKTGFYQSWRLLGPGDTAGANLSAVPVGPSYDRALLAFDPGYGQGTQLGAGTFGVHRNLARGWYRVQTAYALSWSGTQFTIGSATNRRIAAMPF